MGLLIGTVLGLVLGWGVARLHPAVDGGVLVGLGAGALGGWLGALWLDDAFAGSLAGSGLAGAAAGGALCGMVLALVAGVTVVQVRARRG